VSLVFVGCIVLVSHLRTLLRFGLSGGRYLFGVYYRGGLHYVRDITLSFCGTSLRRGCSVGRCTAEEGIICGVSMFMHYVALAGAFVKQVVWTVYTICRLVIERAPMEVTHLSGEQRQVLFHAVRCFCGWVSPLVKVGV
jgi:hypothetical protein